MRRPPAASIGSYACGHEPKCPSASKPLGARATGRSVLNARRQGDHTADYVLGPVLELAVIVAQAGLRTIPPLEPPAALKPFLHFTHKVPGPALRAARRVLDQEPDYRDRVLTVATDELVGEAGMLLLQRPEGWEARLDELQSAQVPADDDAGPTKHDRQLERRLSGAEAALVRSEEAGGRARSELAAMREALADERRQRSRLAAEVERLTAELAVSRREVDGLGSQLVASVEAARHAATVALRQAGELDAFRIASVRQNSLDDALAETAAAVDRVGAVLRDIRTGYAPSTSARGPGATLPKAVRLARPSGRRTPVPLPGAMFDDSPEAADHLLRIDGVLLLVDGYNVAKWKWADVGPADLRQRLLAMVSQVAQRTGARAHIVFDGAFAEPASALTGGSARVRVSFTTADVEADDAILELAAAAPAEQPVVVVSSDRRVRDGAIALGVNAVLTPAFVAACASAAR